MKYILHSYYWGTTQKKVYNMPYTFAEMCLVVLEPFKTVWPCRNFEFGLRPQITIGDLYG
jgi:hypothetical protein